MTQRKSRVMPGSRKIKSLVKAVVVMVVGGLLVKWAIDARKPSVPVAARSSEATGEFGGDLGFLRQHQVGPQSEAESNYYIDLWNPGSLTALARVNGLTNNRALFVDSHGRAGFSWHGGRYGIYPHQNLLEPGQLTPAYSAKDLATVLGPDSTAGIHNIVLAGCNEEGRIRSQEFRRYFINATNITYMTPGKLAFKPMFFQAITLPSFEIRQLHGKVRTTSSTRTESTISTVASAGTEPLGIYVADLYQPGAKKPYRTQKAGRELLEPGNGAGVASAMDSAALVKRR